MNFVKNSGVWLAVLCMTFVLSCTPKKQQGAPGFGQSDLTFQQSVLYQQNPFQGVSNPPQVSEVLRNTWVHSIDADLLWAMSRCACAPNASSKYLQRLVTTFGGLPETLAPDVREQVLNDPKLKTINNLPGGFGDIADIFVGLYVTDSKLSDLVKEGIDGMVQQSIPGSALLSQSLKYRFDLFSNIQLPQELRLPESPKAFSVGDQAIIWSHIFSQPNMWLGGNPMAFGDHGFQFFLTLKALAEWKYILGIDVSPSTGQVYGGLTYDAVAGVKRSPLAPYDARKKPTPPPRFISGQYTVNFADAKGLDMALNVKETWNPGSTEASLVEQALILRSAALAFSRLRPKNRQNTRSLYELAGGILPNDSYLLPVALLPGTAKALETFFINQQEIEVYQVGDKPAEVASNRIKADITTVAKLMSSMMLWVEETKDLSDIENPDIRKQLLDGKATMLKLLRMTVQVMLAEFVREDNVNRTPFGISMVRSSRNMQQPSIGEAAEALATLAQVEQELLPSALVRQRTLQLFHWFAGTYFQNLARGSTADLKAKDIIWTRQALQRFAYYPEAKQAVWFESAYNTLTQQVVSWDGRVP